MVPMQTNLSRETGHAGIKCIISDAKESIWKYRMFLNFNFYTKVRKKIRTLIKMQVGMKISNMHIINIQNTKDK